ncbi:MAG: SMI1/KNR4 family protein [Planctomycetota bacterium]
MIPEERSAAELALGHTLPDGFVDFMMQNRDRLLAIDGLSMQEHVAGGVCITGPDLIACRDSANAAAECVQDVPEECPNLLDWRNDFFIVGDDGGGGYYMMKRDGSPQVWLMDSDWYDEPEVDAADLSTFIQEFLAD